MHGKNTQTASPIRAQGNDDAITSLITACSTPNAGRQSWIDLGRCLIEIPQYPGLIALVEKRQAIAGDGLRLYHDCLSSLLTAGRYEPLRRIINATPRNNAIYIVALYLSGLLACGAEDSPGICEIKLATEAAQSCAPLFEKDPLLNSLLHEGRCTRNLRCHRAERGNGSR